jgi:deazaflavin-dependent oxidoreductase (nitroreductase family)
MLDGMSPRTTAEWRQMNEPVVAEFRTRGGQVSRRYPVLLLTTTGAKTGKLRVTPLNFSVDGDRLVVIASAGGAARHPAWYLNLVADPNVTIELGAERFPAHATTADEPERTRLFDQQASVMSFFDGYRKRVTTRQIPVVVFEGSVGAIRRALTRA